jgi:hypothetical protein
MSEDRLPAAFDRTSLIGTEPYRAGSLGPRSPWSPERGDRRGFLPTPDPEAAGPGRQQRGWKVRVLNRVIPGFHAESRLAANISLADKETSLCYIA